MRKNPYPTQGRVKELFDYGKVEGIGMNSIIVREQFSWRRSSGKAFKGSEVGYIRPKRGDRLVKVDDVIYDVRHMVWIWHYGKIPEGGIVSINGDIGDYTISNLKPRRVPEVSFM